MKTQGRLRDTCRIIESHHDIAEGVRALRRRSAVMRRVHDLTGDPPLRREAAGFAGLARIIVSQQLSAASAAAIWRRTSEGLGEMNARAVLSANEDGLRSGGLSHAKVRTLMALAEAVARGRLDLDSLAQSSDADVHAALTQVRGIGPWTADIYIMFCLGRADAWAAGDLALQLAVARAMNLEQRPDARKLVQLAQDWRPWRSVAARLLWSYHAHHARAAAASRRGE